MTNYEYYKTWIDKIEPSKDFCLQFKSPKFLRKILNRKCNDTNCQWCSFMFYKWLEESYDDKSTDWTKVKIDTPVLVRNHNYEDWNGRYFAKYDETHDIVYVFPGGTTSFTHFFTNTELVTFNQIELYKEPSNEE